MTVSRSSVVREITVAPEARSLGGMALFYGFFVILSLRSFW